MKPINEGLMKFIGDERIWKDKLKTPPLFLHLDFCRKANNFELEDYICNFTSSIMFEIKDEMYYE